MRRLVLTIVTGIVLLLLASWGYLMYSDPRRLIYVDGPFEGQVLDMETKRPIEEAVVLALWGEKSAGIAHPRDTYFEVQETLTDSEGNFTIPGIRGVSLNPLSVVRRPRITIFKPGYAASTGQWDPVEALSPSGPVKLYKRGDQTVFELGRLTDRQERVGNLQKLFVIVCNSGILEESSVVSPDCVPREKISNLIRLEQVERKNLGLQ